MNLLWAGSAIAVKTAIGSADGSPAGHLGPLTVSVARFAPGALLLWLLGRQRGGMRRIERRDVPAFLTIGVVGTGLCYAVFYGGIRLTSATETTLIVAAEPLLLAVAARLLLGEVLGQRRVAGLLLGFGGVYLIVYQGFVPKLSIAVFGNALIALALAFESYASALGKRLMARYPALQVAAIQMLIGSAVLLPFAGMEITHGGHGAPNAAAWGAVAYLALMSTAVGYAIWFTLLERCDLSAMAVFLFVQPVMGPIYAAVLLHERLGLWTAIGAALVVAGVWQVMRREQSAIGNSAAP